MRPVPRLLIVDDSTLVHRFLQNALVDEGLELIHAFNGEDGITQARQALPDVILLDIVMPSVSGFEACARLREDPATAQIPVIFLSGVGDTFNKVQGLDLGAVDFVVKPFDSAELQARVRAALRTKRLVDMLSELAEVDALTGLWNRSHFDKQLAIKIESARRAPQTLSLLMMDIDQFKQCNDQLGHPFGDRVLQSVAGALQDVTRATDISCRFGGDEFAIIFPETVPSEAIQIAELLRAKICSQTLNYRGQRVTVTVSGGLANLVLLEDPMEPPSVTLVSAADSALYSAKSHGRNCMFQISPGEAIFRDGQFSRSI